MLTSKQRSYLRGLANPIKPIFQVGKVGISDNMITQLNEALEAREIIKISVLQNSEQTAKEISNEIALRTVSEVIQVIGNRVVLYKESVDNKVIKLK
jgi:RNA-binding protein